MTQKSNLQKQQQKEAFNAKVEESFRRYSVDPDTFFQDTGEVGITVQRATQFGSNATLASKIRSNTKLNKYNSKTNLSNQGSLHNSSNNTIVEDEREEMAFNELVELDVNRGSYLSVNSRKSKKSEDSVLVGSLGEASDLNMLSIDPVCEKKKKKRKSRWDKRKKSMYDGYDEKSFGPYGQGFEGSSLAIGYNQDSESKLNYADNDKFNLGLKSSLSQIRKSLKRPSQAASQTKTLLHKLDKDAEKYILNPKGIFRGCWDRFTLGVLLVDFVFTSIWICFIFGKPPRSLWYLYWTIFTEIWLLLDICLNLRTGVCLKGSETDVDLRLEVIHKHYICWRRMGIDVLSTVPADMIYEIICTLVIHLMPAGTDLDFVRGCITFKVEIE